MWWIHYILSVVSFIFAFFLITQILSQRRTPGSSAAWLLLIIFIPHLGVPLFFIFGYRKIHKLKARKQKLFSPSSSNILNTSDDPLQNLLERSGIFAQTKGRNLTLFTSPESAYDGLLQSLSKAQHSISITTFILKLDDVGKKVISALEERARSGVQVRLLLDGLGSFSTFRWKLKNFRKAGGYLAYFLPVIHIPFFGHSNLRNHRKLVLIDDKFAIIGGMNIAQEYMGPGPTGHWVDLACRIEGPVVQDLNRIFRADWKFATNEVLPEIATKPQPNETYEIPLQVVPSGPDVPTDLLYDTLALTIFSARKRVWIATPYFIPDDTLSKALEIAARRGVDVRVLLPKKSNHALADFCRRSYMAQLLQAGGKIYCYPRMLHAKAVLIDDQFGLLGSANLDMRSLLLNFELGLFVYSAEELNKISQWYEGHQSASSPAQVHDSYLLRSLDGIGRILGPIL